jgi:hypothetical protein
MCDKDCAIGFSCFIAIFLSLLCIIIFYIGPTINRNAYFGFNDYRENVWNINCDRFSVLLDNKMNDKYLNIIKKEKNKCQRFAATYILEYFLSLLQLIFLVFHFFSSISESCFIKKEILIVFFWIIPSFIFFCLTLLYIIFSTIVLTKESPSYLDYKELMTISLINDEYGDLIYLNPKNEILKTDEDGAFAKYNIDLDKYEFLFPKKDENDIYGVYAKFKDLRLKQYNYNKDLYFKKYFDFNYEFMHCQYNDIESIYNGHGKIYYKDSHGNTTYCQFLYSYNHGENSYNKSLYDRWATTITFSFFIMFFDLFFFICGISFFVHSY